MEMVKLKNCTMAHLCFSWLIFEEMDKLDRLIIV